MRRLVKFAEINQEQQVIDIISKYKDELKTKIITIVADAYEKEQDEYYSNDDNWQIEDVEDEYGHIETKEICDDFYEAYSGYNKYVKEQTDEAVEQALVEIDLNNIITDNVERQVVYDYIEDHDNDRSKFLGLLGQTVFDKPGLTSSEAYIDECWNGINSMTADDVDREPLEPNHNMSWNL